MDTARERYKKRHPDQFSDTVIIKEASLDRGFLDFYLDSITSRGQENLFEVFCRKIAGKEICPNLLPQTGPTGGGDSKVDSETFPVSDSIAITWYSGVGNEAAHERWAFAFSAKKAWKPKVESDIAKIVDVNNVSNRGYTKIFFISNQYVSDKKRADEEDILREKYQIDVRILDRTWLLDQVFEKGHQEIVVECFSLSDSFIEKKNRGPNDYSRYQEIEDLEARLVKCTDDATGTSLIEPALRTAIISRELELPYELTMGRFERAVKIIAKFGTHPQKCSCIFEWAWTIFWWYDDINSYYSKYCEFESMTLNSDNVFNLVQLTYLWFNLFSSSNGKKVDFDIKIHTDRLCAEYEKFISDETRPNTSFEAKANYIGVKVLLGENLDSMVLEYIEILNDCDLHLDFDINTLERVILEIPVFKKSLHFNTLFELLVEKMSLRKQEISAANLLIQRGIELISSKPYSAINCLGRALMRLYKEECKDELIIAAYSMGSCFEQVGLLWAARNYYLYTLCLCINQYYKFGNVHPAIVTSARSLEMTELLLGRVMYATEIHEIENIGYHIYSTENPNNTFNADIKDHFPYILGIGIMKTKYEKLEFLENVPQYFEKHGLKFGKTALMYLLGYYDKEFLSEFEENIDAYDDFMTKWYNQPANKQILFDAWYGFEKTATIITTVLGCSITIVADNIFPCVELGASILSTIESFFSTGIIGKILVIAPLIFIRIVYEESDQFKVEIDKNKHKDFDFQIICSDYNFTEVISGQKMIQEFMLDMLANIMGEMIYFEDAKESLDDMISKEKAFDRSISFSNSIFYLAETFGKDFFDFNHLIENDGPQYPLNRTKPVVISKAPDISGTKGKQVAPKISYDRYKHGKLDLDNINQKDIFINSIINVHFWDLAKWKGVYLGGSPLNEFPPIFSLLFTFGDQGKQIFEEWNQKYCGYDKTDEIQVGIIKGISRENPFHYRVIISAKMDLHSMESAERQILVQNINRLHTMEATTNQNLMMFENFLKLNDFYELIPSAFDSMNQQPIFFKNEKIRKNKSSITIRNSWEIEESSFLLTGVSPSDKPLIPAGKNDAPIMKVINQLQEKYGCRP